MRFHFLIGFILFMSGSCIRAENLIQKEDVWKYYDHGDPGSDSWKDVGFDESGWGWGLGGFAFGNSDRVGTVLSSRDDQGSGLLAAYFRNTFTLSDAQYVDEITVQIRRDDGAVVYINGVEVLRSNMPSEGTVAYATLAAEDILDESVYIPLSLDLSNVALQEGTNLIAVEMHQAAGSSTVDIVFDLQLDVAMRSPDAPVFLTNTISLADARVTHTYVGTLAGQANDPDGDPLVFEKVGGADWLSVFEDGTLGGIPTSGDLGTNVFEVSVSDNQDGSDTAELRIVVNRPDGSPPPPLSATVRYRLCWWDDPATSASIGWEQLSGSNAVLYYGTYDYGREYALYPQSAPVHHVGHFDDSGTVDTCFVRLSGLQPDMAYYFVLKDDFGTSRRLWFRTAPDTPKPFTFIAGGDSRTNPEPRKQGNRLVAKLRPLFVAFTGDMIEADTAGQWREWFDDWQESIASDGRIFPLVPHLGNHEVYNGGAIDKLFDLPPELYYAVTFGGNMVRYYVLNTETTVGGAQADWLLNDLQAHASNTTHLVAGYHKPMRPHTAIKVEQDGEYDAWAHLFYDYGMDLVFEADSHLAKRTYPIRPDTGAGSDEGFVRDDANGTVYTGEGCWGAPLKPANDNKDWTAASGSFYGLHWIHVYPDYLEVFTVLFDNEPDTGKVSEGDVFSLPEGIALWQPASGTRLVLNHGQTSAISYAQWQLDRWALPMSPETRMLDDFDGDGYDNLTEFSFGLNPKIPETDESLAGVVIPSIQAEAHGNIYFNYRRTKGTSLEYAYEISSDLMHWEKMADGVDYVQTIEDNGINEVVELQLIGSYTNNASAFMRCMYGAW